MLQRSPILGLSCRERHRQGGVDQGERLVSLRVLKRIDVADARSAIVADPRRPVGPSKFGPSLSGGAATRGKPEMYAIQLRGWALGPFKGCYGPIDANPPVNRSFGEVEGPIKLANSGERSAERQQTAPCLARISRCAGLCSEGGSKVRRRQQGC